MLRLIRVRVAVAAAAFLVALTLVPPAVAAARTGRPTSDSDFEAASKADQTAIAQVAAARARRQAAESDVHRLDAELIRLEQRSRAAAEDLVRLDAVAPRARNRVRTGCTRPQSPEKILQPSNKPPPPG